MFSSVLRKNFPHKGNKCVFNPKTNVLYCMVEMSEIVGNLAVSLAKFFESNHFTMEYVSRNFVVKATLENSRS